MQKIDVENPKTIEQVIKYSENMIVNAKIENAVDSLNLDGLKEVINIDEFKNYLKNELEKGEDD